MGTNLTTDLLQRVVLMPPTISNHPSDIFELFACKYYNQNAAKLLTIWSVIGRPFRVIAYSSPPVYGVLRHFGLSTYTLNITKMGQATVLNGSARESPVD